MSDYSVKHTMTPPSSDLRICSASVEDSTGLQLRLSTFEQRYAAMHPFYIKLLQAKRCYGTNPAVSQGYDERRANQQASNQQAYFQKQFALIMKAIDSHSFFSAGRVSRFLDLGCAPGGFSRYILTENPKSFGQGITLPHEKLTLNTSSFPADARSRFECFKVDILDIDFSSGVIPGEKANQRLNKDGYDLIIAGAFPTGQIVTQRIRALVAFAQLHAILIHLEAGGNCIFLLNTKVYLWIMEILVVLRTVFHTICSKKHPKIHADRSSAYFVCFGYKRVESQKVTEKVIAAMEELKRDFDLVRTR